MSRVAPNIFILEGNIAAGKSTLASKLADMYGLTLFTEPVEENPYLELFYENPKQWGYQMQNWFFNQRLNTYREAVQVAKTAKGVLLDRSVFSDLVFAHNSYEDGFISEADFKLYNEQYQTKLKELPLPTVILYLDASPETCYYRIHNVRCRPCEASIPLSYLQGLDKCYHAFLDTMHRLGCSIYKEPWNKFGRTEDIYANYIRIEETTPPVVSSM